MADDTELLSFTIDAWTPETIPMVRLADYMHAVATLYGEQAAVHFHRLRKGSAVLQSTVAREAFPRVVARLEQAKTFTPPDDISKAFNAVDDMLRRDNATGIITSAQGATVIEFPGRRAPKPEPITMTQSTTVDGIVVRIGGYDETIPVVLVDNESVVYHCNIRGRERARELAQYLFGAPIRVSGMGKWTRTIEGRWHLENLMISEYEELDDPPLDVVVQELRVAGKGQWTQESIHQWKRERES